MRLSPALLLAVLALAACGGSSGGPPIADAVAAKLARQAAAVAAAKQPCAARDRARALQRQTIAAINAGRIPQEYLEPLQSRVNAIASELELRCLPAPSASAVNTPPPAITPAPTPVVHGHAKHEKPPKHGHDKGKHNGHDD